MELRVISTNLIPNRIKKKYKIIAVDWNGKDLSIDSQEVVPPEVHTEIKELLGLETSYRIDEDQYLGGDETLACFFDSAFQKRTTDVHFEPLDIGVRVRFRVDGYLQTVDTLCFEEYERMLRVIKIQGGMDITENRLPQDGGFRHLNHNFDIRVSIVPSLYGEKTVLRILPIQNQFQHLDKLGMSPEQISIIHEALSKRSGSIIVNGPTGSGKSTTLHAILNEIDKKTQSVLSIEDPIEIIDPDISQFQVNEALGLSYAEYLRRVLRQDPDTILLGEIRDAETARLACEASLTGHYLLSTIHTKTTIDVVLRLLEMKLEPFLVAGALELIVNQRLIRKNCPFCSQSVPLTEELKTMFGVSSQQQGKGCPECNQTGYLGRVGLFEINQVSETTRSHIFSFHDHHNINECVNRLKEGIQFSLRDHAIYLLTQGITTYQEIVPCL